MTEPTRDQRVHRLLRAIEWNCSGLDEERYECNACPACYALGPTRVKDATKEFPHAPDCELAAMIAELEREIIPIPLGSTP